MPELPEVSTISTDLRKSIAGFLIKDVKINAGYKTSPESPDFTKVLVGKKIADVKRVAKNVVISLENGYYLIFHLAMSGRLLLKSSASNEKWTRVTIFLKKGNQTKVLVFTDMRKFGKAVVLTPEQYALWPSKYGIDALDDDLTAEMFYNLLKTKKTIIKNLLLNQKYIAGLGNIYATDALFLAGIHPETSADKLSKTSAQVLLDKIRYILLEGIKNRGATMKDKLYVDIFGNSGTQQEHFRLFSKTECPACGSKIIYKKINSRGSYICPACQKLPKE